jgi:hypothetical protein
MQARCQKRRADSDPPAPEESTLQSKSLLKYRPAAAALRFCAFLEFSALAAWPSELQFHCDGVPIPSRPAFLSVRGR